MKPSVSPPRAAASLATPARRPSGTQLTQLSTRETSTRGPPRTLAMHKRPEAGRNPGKSRRRKTHQLLEAVTAEFSKRRLETALPVCAIPPSVPVAPPAAYPRPVGIVGGKAALARSPITTGLKRPLNLSLPVREIMAQEGM
ncbi:hypothetical protein CDD83_93 [Cordyceps sp. RAO-2017]|nr:hypothetical protein CDD83_93 [Cordyceps sp. RAO-2017]